MKKLYRSDHFCHYNEQRALRAEKKREKEKIKGSSFGNTAIKDATVQPLYITHKVLSVSAPEIFSIVNNREEFMRFLQQFDSQAWHSKPVFINLSNIISITPDALLCIIAYLARYETLSRTPDIGGNSPNDPYCKQILHESGFYKYVSSKFKHRDTENVLSIRNDLIVNPVEASAVIQFVRAKLKITKKVITRSVFTTIMEAMNNVKEHAYGTRKNQGWWLMALPEKDSDIIHFSLADNGKGIPETIRKKWSERITSNDGDLIRAAVLENRSETKLFYRGNGLPKLKKLVETGMIKNLYIISKKGYYFVDEDKVYTLPFDYFGTIIFWDFIRGGKK